MLTPCTMAELARLCRSSSIGNPRVKNVSRVPVMLRPFLVPLKLTGPIPRGTVSEFILFLPTCRPKQLTETHT